LAAKCLATPLKWVGWGKSTERLRNASKVANWTLHDLRRTYATTLASLQVPPHIIEALLNHKTGIISGVAATYNRYLYVHEMREAVLLFEAHFTTIIDA
jgi:integrase